MGNGVNLRDSEDLNFVQENTLFCLWSVVLLWPFIFHWFWTRFHAPTYPHEEFQGLFELLEMYSRMVCVQMSGCSFIRIPKVLCLEKVCKLTHPTIMEFWHLCGFRRRGRIFSGSCLLTSGVYSHFPECRPGVGCLTCMICFVFFLLFLHTWGSESHSLYTNRWLSECTSLIYQRWVATL